MDCTDHIRTATRLANALFELSRREKDCDHDLCLVLDGILSDCAFKIFQAIDETREEIETAERREAGARVTPLPVRRIPEQKRSSGSSDDDDNSPGRRQE